jgi:hypothetical protein
MERWSTQPRGKTRRTRWGVGLVVACFLCSSLAHAHPDLDAGRAAWLEGDFVGALARLDMAERNPSVSEADRVALQWYRAASLYALGRHDDAARALDAVLVLRPMFVPNRAEAPPDLRALFVQRQQAYQEAHGITLGEAELAGASLRVPLGGHVDNVGGVVAFVRVPPDQNYQPVTLTVVETYAQAELTDRTLWLRAGEAGSLEVVVEAHNTRGALAARSGDALQPLTVEVAPDHAALALASLPAPPEKPVELVPVTPPPVVPAAPGPGGRGNHYRFQMPPWFFMLLTTGVTAGCGALSLSGCTTMGLSTIMLAIGLATVELDPSGPTALSGLLTSLTCMVATAFCCTSLPLAACAGALWVTDLFYVNPNTPKAGNDSLELDH